MNAVTPDSGMANELLRIIAELMIPKRCTVNYGATGSLVKTCLIEREYEPPGR
jgi:hypothetical protein